MESRPQIKYLAHWIKSPSCFLCWKKLKDAERTDCENNHSRIISFHWKCWWRIVFDPFAKLLNETP